MNSDIERERINRQGLTNSVWGDTMDGPETRTGGERER